MLTDNFGRTINYLRLAVTDKCNLRCFYCMPPEGLNWLHSNDLLSFDEMLYICTLLVNSGIEKIRITGGEPFVRKGVMEFLTDLTKLNGLKELTITTNGVLTAPLVPELKRLGIKSVNLSLDTLDKQRFFSITHRDKLNAVLETLEQLLNYNIHVKVNAVVMGGKNTEDIIPLVMLAKNEPISVRFIEEMPFNGTESHYAQLEWNHKKILQKIQETFPDIYKIPDPSYSTSCNYHIPGHKGTVGIIAAYTRSFCGTCNRIRITADGLLKMCLYDNGMFNIKEALRNGVDTDQLSSLLLHAISHRAKDGWEAEKNVLKTTIRESMATIGG